MKKAFTLCELLIVIAITGVFFVWVLPGIYALFQLVLG
jgi:prepilin-type N-terminal cleavage/methylation domain-containing protein